ncbi:DUF3427 domain-containing protein, partial [Allohahella marinimesophila]|uniref:DUF3427 domain-containing protein n=1 Tax=Allohahella marinimesophila TaxID=1054972 RepID=UPI0031D332CB
FRGIHENLLAPFRYHGIYDESVDYTEIPWRSGKFDPHLLSVKLATLGRARHALRVWRSEGQRRTLAFCVSKAHAEFMAEQFNKSGVRAAAVYTGSALSRGKVLEDLESNQLQVMFSVDLFNEGVDLPAIDTIMMLRPTKSKILFLQQFGRGLRKAEPEKTHVVVLDFIGNHHSFLHKPQALIGQTMNYRGLAEFADKSQKQALELPAGCFVNYDLKLIDFLKSLDSDGPQRDYLALRETLGRRPTLAEFYRSGANLKKVRDIYGDWFSMVADNQNLPEADVAASASPEEVLSQHRRLLAEIETTRMTKCYKMILLEAFLELDGWTTSPSLSALGRRSWDVLQRRRALLVDLPEEHRSKYAEAAWLSYWRRNPVAAWIGESGKSAAGALFEVRDGHFRAVADVKPSEQDLLAAWVQELIDYKLADYQARLATRGTEGGAEIIPHPALAAGAPTVAPGIELPYFPNLKIACGHFRTASSDAAEYRHLGEAYAQLDPARHFIARASGNSMNGGKHPVHDGDYLLLEAISPERAGSITGDTMAIEKQDDAGDNQYLLRKILKDANGQYVLRAANPDYDDILVDDELSSQLRTFARLKQVLAPLQMAVGQQFQREEIPALFGVEFNPGNWHSGHVVLNEQRAHILLVTLNKQGKAQEHKYHDFWAPDGTFHWQSQNTTAPHSKKGQEIINHERLGIGVHLFVRENKLSGGKAAGFQYFGEVRYQRHEGAEPMSVVFGLKR